MKPLFLSLFIGLCLGGCDAASSDLPTTRMQIGQAMFTLEIAADPDQRATGLMHRESMPDDHGMIFVFPDDQGRRFWMKNTKIPLDILFIRSDGQVVSIQQMEPDTGEAQTSRLVRYAIELNQGAARRAGVKEGDVLELPREVRELRVKR